jgi:membrane protease YdiL (CAAX protease family)
MIKFDFNNVKSLQSNSKRRALLILIISILVIRVFGFAFAEYSYHRTWSLIDIEFVVKIFSFAFAEEFIFRFVLFGVLSRWIGCTWAAVASSLLFSIAHMPGSHFMGIALFIGGLFFCLIYVASNGSLALVASIHAVHNLGVKSASLNETCISTISYACVTYFEFLGFQYLLITIILIVCMIILFNKSNRKVKPEGILK